MFYFLRSSTKKIWKLFMRDWNENESNERKNTLSNKQTCKHSWPEIWLPSAVHVSLFAEVQEPFYSPSIPLKLFYDKINKNLRVIRVWTYHHPLRRRNRHRPLQPTRKDFIRFIISTRRLNSPRHNLSLFLKADIRWIFNHRDYDGSYYRKRYYNKQYWFEPYKYWPFNIA